MGRTGGRREGFGSWRWLLTGLGGERFRWPRGLRQRSRGARDAGRRVGSTDAISPMAWLLPLFSSRHLTTHPTNRHGASLVAQTVDNLPAVQETQVRSLGGEDPLEKEVATHSSVRAWTVQWTEGPGGLQPMRLQGVGHD